MNINSSDSDSDVNFSKRPNAPIPADSSSDENSIEKVAQTYKTNRNQLSSAEESDDDNLQNSNTANKDFSQADVFGSDTEDEEKDIKQIHRTVDSDESAPENNTSYQRNYVSENVEQNIVQEPQELPENAEDGTIEVDFPVIKADLGDEMHLVKLPNFLSVETRPFDPMYYEDELDDDEVQDEEGRTRLKLKVENTIRWRYAKDSESQQLMDPQTGQPMRESNARMVKWSDGSLSLHLGKEIFDVHSMDISNDHHHLFVREGSGLQAQAIFTSKLAFRPHSTDSFTHRKLTLSLADKTHKATKVKLLPFAGENPDLKQQEAAKREEMRIKADTKRENQRRRQQERASHRELTAAFLEQQKDDEANPNAVSVLDIKRKAAKPSSSGAKKRNSKFISDMSSTEDEDEEESLSELSDEMPKKKGRQDRKRRISDDDSFSD